METLNYSKNLIFLALWALLFSAQIIFLILKKPENKYFKNAVVTNLISTWLIAVLSLKEVILGSVAGMSLLINLVVLSVILRRGKIL